MDKKFKFIFEIYSTQYSISTKIISSHNIQGTEDFCGIFDDILRANYIIFDHTFKSTSQRAYFEHTSEFFRKSFYIRMHPVIMSVQLKNVFHLFIFLPKCDVCSLRKEKNPEYRMLNSLSRI